MAALNEINLAIQTYSLARSSKRMIRFWYSVPVLTPRDVFLRTASTLVNRIAVSPFGFRLFALRFLGCFSTFPQGTITLSVLIYI